MPRAQCTACHDHPAALPAALCRACVSQAGRDLRALPGWHLALLERPINGLGGRRSAEQPSPLSDRAGDLRHAIRAELIGWVRITRDANPGLAWPADTVPTIAVWLAQQEAWLLAHEGAGEYARALADLTRRAQRAAAPGRSDLVPIGIHPGTDDQPCGGRVLADPITRDAWCTTCRERGDITWWQGRLPVADEWMTMPQLVTHLAIAHQLQVTPGLIRLWAFRSKVRSQRQDKTATYNVHDAIHHAKESRRVIAGQAGDPVPSETRTASLASPGTVTIG